MLSSYLSTINYELLTVFITEKFVPQTVRPIPFEGRYHQQYIISKYPTKNTPNISSFIKSLHYAIFLT